jgi:hypothetical protein
MRRWLTVLGAISLVCFALVLIAWVAATLFPRCRAHVSWQDHNDPWIYAEFSTAGWGASGIFRTEVRVEYTSATVGNVQRLRQGPRLVVKPGQQSKDPLIAMLSQVAQPARQALAKYGPAGTQYVQWVESPPNPPSVPGIARIITLQRYQEFRFVWLLVLLALLPALCLILRGFDRWRRSRMLPENACRTCGYNLTGNVSGICPECGTPKSAAAPN